MLDDGQPRLSVLQFIGCTIGWWKCCCQDIEAPMRFGSYLTLRFPKALSNSETTLNEVGPFQLWRAIFALAVTATVCVATYLLICYLMPS